MKFRYVIGLKFSPYKWQNIRTRNLPDTQSERMGLSGYLIL